MDGRLFLIDGHSLIFRMYYAFLRRPMVNSKGVDVSILYGFMKYLLELVEKEKPTHLAVCFDPPGKTFRHAMYPEYKGTRQATPELVIEALDPLIELCGALDIPVLMVPGFEGDDVLGSMAVRAAAEGLDVYMVTPDKDFGQLISDRIRQFKPGKSGGENEILGPAEICAKLGLQSPSQVVEMLTLCGDSADNVPGVNGVGEVGASKLLTKYGTVENIYAHLEELTPKQCAMFEVARGHIALSHDLVTIKTDIPLDTTLEQMRVNAQHSARAMELFEHYEFTSLKKYIHLSPGQELRQTPVHTRTLSWSVVGAAELCAMAGLCPSVAVVLHSDGAEGVFSTVRAVTLACCQNGAYYVADGQPEEFRAIFENAGIAKCGYGLKQACNLLKNHNVSLAGTLNDIELMHYLLDPEKSHKLDILSRSYLDVVMEEDAPAVEEEPQMLPGLFDMTESEVEALPDIRFKEAVAILMLETELARAMLDAGVKDLYYAIEEPLQRVLASMEREGVKVDMNSLRAYAGGLSIELHDIEEKVRRECGEPSLNLSSPKQVGTMLFENLRIDPRMKPKASYPTDEETLSNYADSHPIINDILEFRAVKKLLGTYIEPFGQWISPHDGRVHTSFNQALTATGRLSSSRPNLQNIPIRTERGREIRKAFVAPDADTLIVSADYSQIELRLMAHFCGDANMCDAFREGRDVHRATAAKIFGVELDEVTDAMRRTAKTANFGIIYGISAFGLAQRLKIPRVAAKKIIEDYFAGFPSIQQWIEKTKADAAQNGYVQTLFGRRRYLPDITSRNATARALAERNAVNAPIQGTAADIIKMAMNNVAARMAAEGLRSRMVLQIHDELLFEAPRDEAPRLMEVIREEMENVIKLDVPLTVECNCGDNWLEAH